MVCAAENPPAVVEPRQRPPHEPVAAARPRARRSTPADVRLPAEVDEVCDGMPGWPPARSCAASSRSALFAAAVEHGSGLTSLPAERAGPSELLALIRGHWEIENRLHHAATAPDCPKRARITATCPPLDSDDRGNRRFPQPAESTPNACRRHTPTVG